VPEYHRLTSNQKIELYNCRQERKKPRTAPSRPGATQPPGEGKSKAVNNKCRKISAMFTEMVDLKRVAAEMTTLNGDVHREEEKEEPSNRNRIPFKPSGLFK